MSQQKSEPSFLKKILNKFRHGLVLLVLRDYLVKIGIEITPFYWMRETLPPNSAPVFKDDPADYEFSFFDLRDIEAINDLPERQVFNGKVFTNLFNRGKKCYGVKVKGEIAAFTWIDLEESNSKMYPVAMQDNEAYLCDMYVLKAFRGKNLAPVLRYKSYEALKNMGRDTCYSITECYNTPSIKFKKKLNAQFVFMGLHVVLFKKYERRWVLRRY